MRTILIKLCAYAVLLTANFYSVTYATTAWKIDSKTSIIEFTAIQNGAPVKGSLHFDGKINFDPSQLAISHFHIIVDINSVAAAYAEVVDTLKTADFFDPKKFPQATYDTTHFTKVDDKHYQADGKLTIRDKTLPVNIKFTVEQFSPTQFNFKGTADVKRTAFGVGLGEWSNTNTIKDEVAINFMVNATSIPN